MTQIFYDFCSGSNVWTGYMTYYNTTWAIQSGVVYATDYAMSYTMTSGAQWACFNLYRDLGANYNTTNTRAYIRFDSDILSIDGTLELMGYLTNTSLYEPVAWRLDIKIAGGVPCWKLSYLHDANTNWDVVYLSSGTIAADTWYCVEVRNVCASSGGSIQLWVNESTKYVHSGLANFTNMRKFANGLMDEVGGHHGVVYFDEFKITDGVYIGSSISTTTSAATYYSLTIVSAVGGTCTPPYGTSNYIDGASVTIRANASSGYTFVRWD